MIRAKLIAARGLQRITGNVRLHQFAGRLFNPRSAQKTCRIQEAQRILVLKPDEIGDVVLATGFLRALRRQCVNAHITLAVKKVCAELVQDRTYCDEVLLWEDAWRTGGSKATLSVAWTANHQWRKNRPEWVLIPRSCADYYGAALYAWWSGGLQLCAHESFCRESIPQRHRLVNCIVPTDAVGHEIEFHRKMLRHLGLDSKNVEPSLTIPDSYIERADAFLKAHEVGTRFIALGIGAAQQSKCWPAENFEVLATELLRERPEVKIVVLGGTAELGPSKQVCRRLNDRIINAVSKLSLLENAALLQKCSLYVGNDTGLMHLAAFAGCAVVEISKHPKTGASAWNESPVRFGPLTAHRAILQPDEARESECKHGCIKAYAHCIAGISVDMVLRAALHLSAVRLVPV